MLKTIFLILYSCIFFGVYAISYHYDLLIGISVYGVVMILYFLTQLLFSALNHKYYFNMAKEGWLKKNSSRSFLDENLETIVENPFKCVLMMVGHQERMDYWEKALKSIITLNSQNISHVYLIIDGDSEDDQYMNDKAHEILDSAPISYQVDIVSISHRGKRGAMLYGFERIRNDYPNQENNIDVVVSDSDTQLEENCIVRLQECLRSNSNNGCATGILAIFNLQDGILPKMIHARYSYAFMIERGATSYFGCMTCCSGPISIYKLSVLNDLILKKFITQSFLTVKCEPGDDRHLTNLVLASGYFARQTNLGCASTEAPETMQRFLNQQLRWSRSYFRELYWQIKAIEKQSYYLSFVTVYETLFPFFVTAWMIKILYVNKDIESLYRGVIISIGILIIRTCILFAYIQKAVTWYNLFYYPTYLFLLLPTKIFAVYSLLNNRWVTMPRSQITVCQFSSHFLFLGLWNLMLLGGLTRHLLLHFGILH